MAEWKARKDRVGNTEHVATIHGQTIVIERFDGHHARRLPWVAVLPGDVIVRGSTLTEAKTLVEGSLYAQTGGS